MMVQTLLASSTIWNVHANLNLMDRLLCSSVICSISANDTKCVLRVSTSVADLEEVLWVLRTPLPQ